MRHCLVPASHMQHSGHVRHSLASMRQQSLNQLDNLCYGRFSPHYYQQSSWDVMSALVWQALQTAHSLELVDQYRAWIARAGQKLSEMSPRDLWIVVKLTGLVKRNLEDKVVRKISKKNLNFSQSTIAFGSLPAIHRIIRYRMRALSRGSNLTKKICGDNFLTDMR